MALLPRIIPCLDVKGGRVVKGRRFSSLREVGDPVELARGYASDGADELVLLDVSATEEERVANLHMLSAIRERIAVPLTVGGGVRSFEDALRLVEAGADKVSVNTAAVRDPSLLSRLADELGSQCVVVAIDARRTSEGPRVAVRSGQELVALDAVAWAVEATRRGAGEVLLTAWDRDGMQSGYDLELIGEVVAAVAVPVVASGGAAGPRDLVAAWRAGAQGALVASILHDGAWTVRGLKEAAREEGVEVRGCS